MSARVTAITDVGSQSGNNCAGKLLHGSKMAFSLSTRPVFEEGQPGKTSGISKVYSRDVTRQVQ